MTPAPSFSSVEMVDTSSSSVIELASPSSSVEMVDLTQDTCIMKKQQSRRTNDNALPGGFKEAQEMGLVTSAKANMVVVPSESSKQERGLVISAAARKKILEMALGQSVSTFAITY